MRRAPISRVGSDIGASKMNAYAASGTKLVPYHSGGAPSRFENQAGEAETTTRLFRRSAPSEAKVSAKSRSPVPACPRASTSNPVGRRAKTSVGRNGRPQQKSSELP